MALMVDEIFTSIQGEGYDSGLLTIFVRLYGCPLKCKYCDQPQKKGTAKKMSVENLLTKIHSLTDYALDNEIHFFKRQGHIRSK